MINKLKKLFYFPLAYYFRFFAQIQLAIWKPKIIVVTGSSGKTTLLHLIESQIQDKARYSHLANSSYGIPFDILGLKRTNLTLEEWPRLFLLAPFKAFKKPYKEKLYIVEADCDRPYEGKFLAMLLKPEITLWTGVGKTHTMNFDSLVLNRHSGKPRSAGRIQNLSCHGVAAARDSGQARLAEASAKRARMTDVQFSSVEDAIAHEFGYFLEATSKLSIVNADSQFIKEQMKRSRAQVKSVAQRKTDCYKIFKDHTEFKINGTNFAINALLPKETSYSIAMVNILLDFINEQLIIHRHSGLSRISLHREESERDSGVAASDAAPQNDDRVRFIKIKPDPSFSKFSLPPGRCSLFKGIKNTTIIDSSYNATPEAVMAILRMFDLYPSDKKWLVLGDMIELGEEEQEEHERLADIIASMKLEKIILVGPRLIKYTYPRLTYGHPEFISGSRSLTTEMPKQVRHDTVRIKKFTMPKDALDYLINNLKGGEVILFKGARFLEGIIEHLLADKNDVKKLCRREKIWQIRRKKWGL